MSDDAKLRAFGPFVTDESLQRHGEQLAANTRAIARFELSVLRLLTLIEQIRPQPAHRETPPEDLRATLLGIVPNR